MSGTEQRDAAALLADPASYRDRRLNCDLVMKGGITSGVVYPLAVAELARTYRFKNIGGTSAGAIAAVAAAAAQHEGNGNGFAQLAKLPSRLGTELETLFRPQRRCKRLFRLIFASAKRPKNFGERLRKPVKLVAYLLSFLASIAALGVLAVLGLPAVGVGVGLRDLISDHWWHGVVLLALLSFTVIAASGLRRGSLHRRAVALLVAGASIAGIVFVTIAGGLDGWAIAAWLAVCVITVVLTVVLAIVLEAFRVLPANDYGLVGGSAVGTDHEDGDVEPLSEWLHTLIQQLAGLDGRSPLTFGQVFDGPSGARDDGVNLTLLTTCISQGRTYYLPWDLELHDPEDRFYFDPVELRRSMPGAVVDYLVALDRNRSEEKDWLDVSLAPLVPLPSPDRIPVVMAARMSLSFPVLISTVPLRAVDWTLKSNQEARRQWRKWDERRVGEPHTPRPSVAPNAERCYFSDGGIISNFPVHLFDAMLPRHPTFAINLREFHPDRVEFDDDSKPEIEKIWRPTHNGSGYSEWWTRWSQTGAGAVFGFVKALRDSLQNWSDNDQIRVPGYRDRVVHVSHGSKEGGLNLAMPADRIGRLGERGRLAAVNLEEAFANPPPGGVTTGWRNHKWIRLRSSLALLTAQVASIGRAFDADDPADVESYRDLLGSGPESAPSYQATRLQRSALLTFLDGEAPVDGVGPHDCGVLGASRRLASKVSERATVSPDRNAPGPAPTLRVAPGHRQAPPTGAPATPSVAAPDVDVRP